MFLSNDIILTIRINQLLLPPGRKAIAALGKKERYALRHQVRVQCNLKVRT